VNTYHHTDRLAVVAVLISLLLPVAACGTGRPPRGASTSAPSPAAPVSTPPGSSRAAAIAVTSAAFGNGRAIPARYSCHGRNQPPPLAWTGVPPHAVALALVMDDPDAVGGRYIHWVVTDIPPAVGSSAQGQSPPGGRTSANSGGDARYLGPCPPSGSGLHHYRFTVYGLSRMLGLTPDTAARTALAAIEAAAVGQGRLVGTYAAA
jgi:Raf kinase inhibitor-like YbhB/YbcL family protein